MKANVVIVGAGHNGLAAALKLKRVRPELGVTVLEAAPVIGGACRTEKPFLKAPDVPTSTGAYLAGPIQPEILADLGIADSFSRVLRVRRPHYFLPTTTEGRYLLFSDSKSTLGDIARFFGDADRAAYAAMQDELELLRNDLGPCWFEPQLPLESAAERFVRPELRKTFIDLCRGSVHDYLRRFGFQSELLVAMLAITDGLSGLRESIDAPGTGFNYLLHNMCRLPGSNGTWMRVEGGMGTIPEILAREFLSFENASIRTGRTVVRIDRLEDGANVLLAGGERIAADAVIVNADPSRLLKLVEHLSPPAEFGSSIRAATRPGSTLKVNLCLSGLPTFTCLRENRGQFEGTIHLIPDSKSPLALLEQNYRIAEAGALPARPAIEWYFDTNLRDDQGRFSSALFVPCMPDAVRDSSWSAAKDGYLSTLLDVCAEFCPDIREKIVDVYPLSPPDIESHFGITGGQIHHLPNTTWDRFACETPINGVFSASAACHPGGSVTLAPGYICAKAVLDYLTRRTGSLRA